MLVTVLIEESNILVTKNVYFKGTDKEKYKKQFEKMKNNGVFRSDVKFEDKRWIAVANDIETIINMEVSETTLRKALNASEIDIKVDDFITGVKAYALNTIEYTVPKTVNYEIRKLFKLIEIIGFFESGNEKDFKGLMKNFTEVLHYGGAISILDFMGIVIPEEYYDIWCEQLDAFEKKGNIRVLPDFKSIFAFGVVMQDFIENATQDDFIKYGVVALWWEICNRVPLRPTEFALLPRECTFKEGDNYYLRLRRNKGKGPSSMKKIIDKNGVINTYEDDVIRISENLFNIIDKYKKLTYEINPQKDEKYLFSKKIYEEKILVRDLKKEINKERFTSYNLRNTIYSFYEEIVVGRYKKQVCTKNEKKVDYEGKKNNKKYKEKYKNHIEMLVPYDLRHVAIINLIMMGCEPLTVMKMAGHQSIKTTKGYYDHIEEYGKSYIQTYSKYLKGLRYNKADVLSDIEEVKLDNIIEIKMNNSALATWKSLGDDKLETIKYKEVDGGRCKYQGKDFSPCYAVGVVHARCPYFIADSNIDIIKEFYTETNGVMSVIETIKYLVENHSNIVDFSEKYSVAIEALRDGLGSASMLISNLNDDESVEI